MNNTEIAELATVLALSFEFQGSVTLAYSVASVSIGHLCCVQYNSNLNSLTLSDLYFFIASDAAGRADAVDSSYVSTV